MPLTIPTAVATYFTLYPDGQKVFVREDGTTYLAHFQDKALQDAKVENDKLYQFSVPTVFSQIHPTTGFHYLNPAIDGVNKIRINGQERALLALTKEGLKDAGALAANAAGLVAMDFDTSIEMGDIWNLNIELNESGATVEVFDDNDDWVNVTES